VAIWKTGAGLVAAAKRRSRQASHPPRAGGKHRTAQRTSHTEAAHDRVLTSPSQRAFRERKERHVRELEAKLSALENSTHSLQSDNERLKLALQRARTENEILRATSGGQHSPPSSRPVSVSYPSPGAHLPDEINDDESYNVQSLSNGNVVNSADKDHTASRRKTKGKEVPAAQTWDLIQSHPLVKQGLVDIADVCERLKGAAKCDGHGPVFEESAIWRAVEESRRGGGDELI
jgi:AP-1-like factor